MNLLDDVLVICGTINSKRSVGSIYHHLTGEVDELRTEVINKIWGYPSGEDGIIGESVDVILCAIDLIYQDNPNITNTEIMDVVYRKINKWVTKYGNGENENV